MAYWSDLWLRRVQGLDSRALDLKNSRVKPFMKGFTRALGEGVRRVTIHDVAGKAGVSTAAVSHAFNDPERLRATTVTRILDAARELGYAPNPQDRKSVV